MEQERVGRAADANGKKSSVIETTTTVKSSTPMPTKPTPELQSPAVAKPRRKPRKLNKDNPPSIPALEGESIPAAIIKKTQDPTAELDALKSRVRGLEAKVEALYESKTRNEPSRSPRRRGKGRKTSSSTQVSTLNRLPNTNRAKDENHTCEAHEEEEDEEEEDIEELVRLEGELEVARQDLDSYPNRPSTYYTELRESDENVEEIPRNRGGSAAAPTAAVRKPSQGDRQVTLSGSYRIPIPTNVSLEDVKKIKGGVAAVQNVARRLLEQRRAAVAAARAEQNQNHGVASTDIAQQSVSSTSARPVKTKATGAPSATSVTLEEAGDRQSWGDWIGGYSLAITRAVKNIEHEAAMESHKDWSVGTARSTQLGRTENKTPVVKQNAGKRSPVKAKLSSEQVHNLMS
ncbi:hypothetical protein LEMA_P108020.1 [Plenodomus lingam JN3]|uniref:Uncharacterized protein n=1 Tax=Leptosphaeria maculans (strain JN3 / isolate v23.1.3 / race Av1-4-5-6-7-8) TaxID=985895 RepID=E4ZYL1_LEPMJ|nr:hypothetical protein LEMA_P108020.1 [Plenodomus lingam JN3]CBX96537.1 hypothetical protein LEMA_P108020.1 [Plenodomus lingam JN3]